MIAMKKVARPLLIVLTAIAILGFLIQIFYPNLYFSSQEEARIFVEHYQPYDQIVFILVQILQVIVAPISHYVVGILGGVLYGPVQGGCLNWIGRMAGHIAAYWIGRTLGRTIVKKIFSSEDLHKYEKIVNGTPQTLHIRLFILFAIMFLPFFPDDEISYLVGLAGLHFKYYVLVLALGHLGGSFGLAYIGAGIDAKDTLFWVIFVSVIILAILLVWAVRRLGQTSDELK